MAESKLQVAWKNWAEHALPDVITYHIYNENSVNAIQGKIKKERGVLAGVHDNMLHWFDGVRDRTASLELKDPDKPPSANKYSPSQLKFAKRLDVVGIPHACCQNGAQIEAYIASLGLKPKFRFPVALEATQRLMLQEAWMDELYRR